MYSTILKMEDSLDRAHFLHSVYSEKAVTFYISSDDDETDSSGGGGTAVGT